MPGNKYIYKLAGFSGMWLEDRTGIPEDHLLIGVLSKDESRVWDLERYPWVAKVTYFAAKWHASIFHLEFRSTYHDVEVSGTTLRYLLTFTEPAGWFAIHETLPDVFKPVLGTLVHDKEPDWENNIGTQLLFQHSTRAPEQVSEPCSFFPVPWSSYLMNDS